MEIKTVLRIDLWLQIVNLSLKQIIIRAITIYQKLLLLEFVKVTMIKYTLSLNSHKVHGCSVYIIKSL